MESSFTDCQNKSLPEKLWVHWGESLECSMRVSKKKSESLNLYMDFKLDIIIMFPVDLIESLTLIVKVEAVGLTLHESWTFKMSLRSARVRHCFPG